MLLEISTGEISRWSNHKVYLYDIFEHLAKEYHELLNAPRENILKAILAKFYYKVNTQKKVYDLKNILK